VGSVNAEDFDPIDTQQVEVHDGHPVELGVSVRLDAEESKLLTELADAEGPDPAATPSGKGDSLYRSCVRLSPLTRRARWRRLRDNLSDQRPPP
jgi:hypothetical protein